MIVSEKVRNKKIFSSGKMNYILRYYLPYWDAEERLKEIVDFCESTGTRNIMFMVGGPQHIFWNQISMDIVNRELKSLALAKEKLSPLGIRFGLNISVTVGHAKCPFDHRDKFPSIKNWHTTFNGVVNHNRPCPLDPEMHRNLLEAYKAYATSEPDYIYIDDDLRYMMHPHNNVKDWGCACQLHLDSFAKLTGEKWEKDRLWEAITNNKEIRSKWIEMLGQSLFNIAENISNTIREANPEIAVGVMIPCLGDLPLSGYNIPKMIDTVGKNGSKVIVRPCIGGYSDHNRRDLVGGLCYMEYIDHVLTQRDIEYTPELETTPFTRLSKSMKVVRFQISQAILNGMNNPAITTAGYVGDHVDFEPEFKNFLSKQKSYFDALIKLTPKKGTKQGIQFMFDADSAKMSKSKPNIAFDLAWPIFTQAKTFGSLGLNYTFDDSPVKLLSGDTPNCISQKELEEILSADLILDSSAAKALIEMGYENSIGLSSCTNVESPMSEECFDKEFCGPYRGTYIPLMAANSVYSFTPKENSKILTWICNPDMERLCPGTILYKNRFGGKVAVLPFSFKAIGCDDRHLICYQRQYLLRKIIEWMNPLALPVYVENPTDFLVQCWDDGKTLTTCITNLSYDRASEIKTVFEHYTELSPEKAVYLAHDGSLKPLTAKSSPNDSYSRQIWTINYNFEAFDPVVIQIPYC